jgi:hypothetical protein
MKKAKAKQTATVRTSVTLDRELWKRAWHRAVEEDCGPQDLIAHAVETHLKTALRGEGGKE